MKIDCSKRSNQDQKGLKCVAYINMLETWVTIFGTIIGVLLTWSQLRIAHSEEVRAQRAEPLAYNLESVNTHYQYEIQQGDATASLPAPSFRLQVTHGSLHSITAISFDGDEFHQLDSLPIQDSWNSCTVDITMPAQSVIVDGNTVYDYFFLLLEPTEGQYQLDLVYNIIDLDTQQVRSKVLHAISLVQLDFLCEGPQKEMLSVYHNLRERLDQLACSV